MFLIITGCAAKSPLIQASSKGDSSGVQKLIKGGANINEVDKNGETPLMHASKSADIETVKLLLSMGADIKIIDKYGNTALSHAIIYGYEDVSKILIENHADVNTKNNDGDTPLIIASYNGNPFLIKLLTDNGAYVNAKNGSGMTPLHYAAQYIEPGKNDIIIKILLEHGADASIKDNYGLTPLKYALTNKAIENVVLIRTKYQGNDNLTSLSVDDALRVPSNINPEKGAFLIPPGKEEAYTNAISDCNDLIIPYKKGLLIVTGPIGYGAGLVIDAATTPRKFQKCMETMGFKCLKDCKQ